MDASFVSKRAFVSKEQLLFLHSVFFLSSYRDMNTFIVASIGYKITSYLHDSTWVFV